MKVSKYACNLFLFFLLPNTIYVSHILTAKAVLHSGCFSHGCCRLRSVFKKGHPLTAICDITNVIIHCVKQVVIEVFIYTLIWIDLNLSKLCKDIVEEIPTADSKISFSAITEPNSNANRSGTATKTAHY